jgi:hypothetical protein
LHLIQEVPTIRKTPRVPGLSSRPFTSHG